MYLIPFFYVNVKLTIWIDNIFDLGITGTVTRHCITFKFMRGCIIRLCFVITCHLVIIALIFRVRHGFGYPLGRPLGRTFGAGFCPRRLVLPAGDCPQKKRETQDKKCNSFHIFPSKPILRFSISRRARKCNTDPAKMERLLRELPSRKLRAARCAAPERKC